MLYLIDQTSKPKVIVHETEDAKDAASVAQAYANQTGRAVQIVEVLDLMTYEREVAPATEYSPHPEVHSHPRSVDGT